MNAFRAARGLGFSLFALGILAHPVRAQEALDDEVPATRKFVSPEHFAIEFRVGPFQPDMGGNAAFDTFFGGDKGPLLGLELDFVGYRVPDLVYFAGGARIGTASYSGYSLDSSGMATAEKVSLSLLPIDALAVVRVDALARKLSVPFIFTGKLGYEWTHWSTQTGAQGSQAGWSVGLVWGTQVALDLDVFDRKAARTMDEEWGINHSFVFFELFGTALSAHSLPVGATAWVAGLGFMF